MPRSPKVMCDICRECLKGKYLFETDDKEYLKNVEKLIAEQPNDRSSGALETALINEFNRHFKSKDYKNIKVHFNELVSNLMPKIEEHINNSQNKLYSAIKMAIMANYIDYSAFKDIQDDKLIDALFKNEDKELNNFDDFYNDILKAKTIVYLTDNCGEVVLDKYVIKLIKELNPLVRVIAMVRGAEVLNDASLVDAKQIKLDEVCEVLDNGLDIAGSTLKLMSKDRVELLTNADIIISKGQANAETLLGSGLNIYYLLLCKCAYFVQVFNTELYTPLLEKERID